MSQISKLIRDAIKSQAADPIFGFNPRFASVASAYGVDSFTIDFGPKSFNFIFGQVPPDLIEQSSVLTYPLMTIDTLTVRDTDLGRPATFAGQLDALIQLHVTWEESQAVPDFSSLPDACEDAVFAMMNDPAHMFRTNNVAYAGRMDMTRSPVIMAGENWRRTLSFVPHFTLLVP